MRQTLFIENVMGFWAIIFWIVLQAAIAITIGELTKKKIKVPSVEPNDLNMPLTEEGVRYTIGFGTFWIENPVISWWGNVATAPIVRHYYESKWFNQKRVYYTIGHHYEMGLQEILTQGQNDGIKQMKVDDTLIWPDPDNPSTLQADGASSASIDLPNIFGGEEAEGGIVGTLDFEYGERTQAQNDYLVSILGSDISATRGVTSVVKRRVRFGTSPYPKPWRYLIKRTDILTDGTAQWYISKAVINTLDLNPAHILRECYTNTEWGFGYSTGLFNETTWQAFADDLYDEGFGLSLKWEDSNQTLEDFVKDVLRHIDGILYQDPSTGMFTPKLIRYDYIPAALEEFNDSDIESVSDFTRGALHRIPNTVWLKYWNREANMPVSIIDHDLALINQQTNKIVPHEVSYIGVMNDALAGQLVARERQQLTSFLAVMKIKAKRTMGHIRPGDVFKLTWPILGISQMIVRVVKPNYGTLNEGYVTLDCVEDVFSVQTALYSTPPASGWTSPINDPAAVSYRLLGEAPFWDVYRDAGLSEALLLDADSGFLLVTAKQPTSDALDFELMLRDSPTDSFFSDGRGFFTPNGTLDSYLPLNATDAVVDLVDAEGLADVEVGTYVVIENEILKVKGVDADNSQVTLARGCLDTVPEYHSGDDSGGPGARVWFVGAVSYISGREYTATNQPGVKILTRTAKGQLSDDTAYNADAFDSRMNRPYPPGNIKVNSVSYPSSFSGQPTITWNHRDRTQQLSEIYEHTDAGVGPEAGTTYTISIYDETGTGLLRTVTGLTGTTYTYSYDDEIADSGLSSGDPLNSSLRFVLKSVRSGYDSWQSYDLTVNRV